MRRTPCCNGQRRQQVTEEFRRITGRPSSIVDALSMPGLSDIDVDFSALGDIARPADFT